MITQSGTQLASDLRDVMGRHRAHRQPLRVSHGVVTTLYSSAALSCGSFTYVPPAKAQAKGPGEAARDSRTQCRRAHVCLQVCMARGWPGTSESLGWRPWGQPLF